MLKKTRINIRTTLKIYIKVLQSFLLSKGKKNEEIFKNSLKKFLATDNISLTSQGRVAAFNIFKVLISEKKKEILICPYTLTEIIHSIIYAGGKPVFVEIDLKKGLPLEKDLDQKINENTAGLVLTHLYSNKEDILNFHKKYNNKIKIIEDAAINFGAKVDHEKSIGTLFDYGFYSFGIMKHICTFNGGAIYSKDQSKLYEIEQNLKKNMNYPTMKSLKLIIFCMFIDIFYSKYVYNFFTYYVLKLSIKKLDKLMNPNVYPELFESIPKNYYYKFQSNFAISGIENLKIIANGINNRIEKVKLYENYLNTSLKINNFSVYQINSFLEFPVLLKKTNNKFLSKELLKKGYDIRRTWYVNSLRYFKSNFVLEKFFNCENLHEKVLSLPTHDNISEKDIVNICKIINFHENNEK